MQQSQMEDQRASGELAQRMTKIEKFVSNLDALMKKMTEKMEQIESQNVRNTMKYNSFREDYKRLIEEQVDMRTAGHKGEFVGMDQIRTVRVAMKEVQMRMKNKVDINIFSEQIGRKERETLELLNKNKTQHQKYRIQMHQHIEKLKRADEILKIHIQKEAVGLRQFSKSLNDNLAQSISATQQAIQNIKLRINELSQKNEQIDRDIANQRSQVAEQFKTRKQEQLKRFSDFQRKSQQIERNRRNEIEMRLQKILIAFQALDARQTSNNEKLRKDHSAVESKFLFLQSTMASDKQFLIDRISTLQGNFQGFRLEQTNHNEISEQHFQSFNEMHQNFQKQLSNLKQKMKKTQMRRETQATSKDTQRLNTFRREDNQTTIDPTQTISYNNEIHSFKTSLQDFKKRTQNIEHIMNIIQETVERKVNLSEVIQLQESKCSKLIFKDLIMKLQTFKAILQRNFSTVSHELKELVFDETGHSQSVLSRASKARSRSKVASRNDHRRDLSSLGETERYTDKIESPIMTKPASAMSRSRRRYLTFFQSIDTNSDKPIFN